MSRAVRQSASKQTAVVRLDAKFRAAGSSLHAACEVDGSVVRHWKQSSTMHGGRDGAIPDRYHARILAAAKRLRLTLDPAEMVNC